MPTLRALTRQVAALARPAPTVLAAGAVPHRAVEVSEADLLNDAEMQRVRGG